MAESGTSETTIFNAALTHLGEAKRILDANENSSRAMILAERYPNLRDALIRQYKWNFSTRRASLSEDATPPAFGYAHRYKTPANCLKVFNVIGERHYPWKVEGGYVVTDLTAPLNVIYALKVTDPSEFDPVFREVLAMDLAIACAPAIANKRTLKLDLVAARQGLIETAEFCDADEGQEEDLAEGSWLEARHS